MLPFLTSLSSNQNLPFQANTLNINTMLAIQQLQYFSHQKQQLTQIQQPIFQHSLFTNQLTQQPNLNSLTQLVQGYQLLNNVSKQFTHPPKQASSNPFAQYQAINMIIQAPQLSPSNSGSSQATENPNVKVEEKQDVKLKPISKKIKKAPLPRTAPSSDSGNSPKSSKPKSSRSKNSKESENIFSDAISQKDSSIPVQTPEMINEEPETLDYSLKEGEPALCMFTRNFPDWDLGEILDLFMFYTPEAIRESKRWHKVKKEQKIQEEIQKKEQEEAELMAETKPKIRTRHWKNNDYNRKKDGEAAPPRKNYVKRTFLMRLRQMVEMDVIDDKKAHGILATNDMDLKKALSVVQGNLEYYRVQLAI